MKFGAFTDPHNHCHKQHSTIVDGMNSRLATSIHAMEVATQVAADEYGIDTMFVCGDVFHVRGNLKPSVLNAVARSFENGHVLHGMNYVIIAGNHDMENYQSGESAIDILSLVPGVTTFNEPDIVEVEDKMVLAIPYIHGTEAFRDCYENMVAMHTDIDIVMIHQYIDDFTPEIMDKTGITVGYLAQGLKPGAVVLCGHYHEHAVKVKDGVMVCNIGSLLPMKFGDENEYGFMTFDTMTGSSDFQVVVTPKFQTFTSLPRGKSELERLVFNNYVRIKAETVAKGESMKARCIDAGALSVVVQVVKSYEAKDPKDFIEISTDEKMFDEFLAREDCGVPKEMITPVRDLFRTVCLGAIA